MKIRDVVIVWTPASVICSKTAGQCEVFSFPDEFDNSYEYEEIIGGDSKFVPTNTVELHRWLLATALGMIWQDGIDPDRVYRGVMKIDEFNEAICHLCPSGEDHGLTKMIVEQIGKSSLSVV